MEKRIEWCEESAAVQAETGARRRAYFAASNSEDGFHSRYESCFRGRADRTYIIKGGPGTGKSRLMREVTEAAERAGWTAELYFCSSDPDSLDAVFLQHADGRSLTLLDGTAPHVMEAESPGAREQLIDLGAYWDEAALYAQRERIATLTEQKQEAYALTYDYLRAAGQCMRGLERLLAPAVNQNALERLVVRLVSGASSSGKGASPRGAVFGVCTDALSMRGRVHLPTFEEQAVRLCSIERCYGLEYTLLRALLREGLRRGERMTVSYHPVFREIPDALFFEDSGVAFVIHTRELQLRPSCYHREIKLRRLTDAAMLRQRREALRAAQRQRDALLSLAEGALAKAKEPHFALEDIYSAAMDFAAKEAMTNALCAGLF